MSTTPPKDEQPELLDDEVEASRAPLMDHLIELRGRLIKSLIALSLCSIISFFFAQEIYDFLLLPFARVAEGIRGARLELIFTGPMEFFFVKLKLAVFAGIFLSFPVVAFQIYRFVAPGLYTEERNAFWPYLVFAPLLFTIGAMFVYFLMLPMLARFSISQEQIESGVATIKLLPRVAEYLSLVMALMLAFGLSFQLPVILSLLGRVGIVSAEDLSKGRKYAVVGILAFAAFFTPPDVVSQVLLTVPVYLLYEISIWSVRMIEKKQSQEDAASAAE